MARVVQNISLKPFNTFGFNVFASYFASVGTENDLHELLSDTVNSGNPVLVLGGGSNILFTDNFKGLVIKPDFTSIEVVSEAENDVMVRVGAGVEWDSFVLWAVERGLGGLENLSAIPGTVGASPVQNIGAYGAEVKDSIYSVEGFFIHTAQKFYYPASECQFGYRTSIFKTSLKGKFVISFVTFRLNKHTVPNVSYAGVAEKARLYGEINLHNVRKAIIDIRTEKLPDYKIEGNAGSFFKNPVVSMHKAKLLKGLWPDMPVYGSNNTEYKLSAAFLIEQAGWKGFRTGDAGVHNRQPLVLVNYGNASGLQVYDLAQNIAKSVFNKFGVLLEMEVNVVPQPAQ